MKKLIFGVCLILALSLGSALADTLVLPAETTAIEAEAFRGLTSATEFQLPSTVTEIGDGAFRDCGDPSGALRYYFSPAGVTVGADAFTNCRAVIKLNGTELPHLSYTVGDAGVTITGMSGSPVAVDIPALIEGKPVVAIGNNAFAGKREMLHVTIPSTVTAIGGSAFDSCQVLEKITLPEGLVSIGEYAFKNCLAMTQADLPSTVREIGKEAFCYCQALTRVVIPEGVTSIGIEAYYDCRSMTQLTLPSTLTEMGQGAFRLCSSLTEVILPEGLTEIPQNAFRSCTKLATVRFPSGLTSIGQEAFRDACKGQQGYPLYQLPASVETVGSAAFTDCGAPISVARESDWEARAISERWLFVYADSPDFVYKNDYYAGFSGYQLGLYGYAGSTFPIRLPDDAVGVRKDGFKDYVDAGLVAEQMSETATALDRAQLNHTFPGHEDIRYRVINNVLQIMGWAGTGNAIEIPAATAYIEAGMDEQIYGNTFQNLTGVTRLVVPEGVSRMNDSAFSGCENLTDISLPNSLKSMGPKIFRYAGQNLNKPFYLTLPDNMEDLVGRGGGANSFEDLNAVLVCGKTSQTAALLTDRNYVYSAPGELDFRYRYLSYTEGEETGRRLWLVGYEGDATSVQIPAGIYGIRYFNNNTASSNWPTFHGYGFRENATVTSVVIPEGTAVIEDSAFSGCENLTDITFPSTLKTLKNHAFERCGKNAAWLHYYVLPDNMTDISTNTDAGWGAFTDIGMGRLVTSPDCTTAKQLSGIDDKYNHGGRYQFALKGHETDGLLYLYEQRKAEDSDQYVDRLILRQYEGTADSVTIPADCGVYAIADSVFAGHSELRSISIPEGVVSIGSLAFSGCSSLRGSYDFTWTGEGGEVHTESNIIRLPDTLKTLGSGAFQEVGSAVSDRFYLYLPASLEALDTSSVLYHCNAVMVAPGGAAATALYNGWYYYYSSLQDAILGTNCLYQRVYENGKEVEHVHYGRR